MTKGFMQAFDYKECDFIRLNCWPHTERNLKAKVKVVKSAETRSALWKDIHLIQLAHSSQAFQLMCSQFIKKWKSIKDKDINTFIAYMERSWIEKNNNWFEGAAPGLPSSNNALEATNLDIKDSFTFRERLSMEQFFPLLFRIILKWSEDRIPTITKPVPDVCFFKQPPLDTALETKAFEFAQLGLKIHDEGDHMYWSNDDKD